MVPADSDPVSRDGSYSGALREACGFHLRDSHPLWSAVPNSSVNQSFVTLMCKVLQPHRGNPRGLGCSAFARRYLRNRFFFLFLVLLRCFSSHGLPQCAYEFSTRHSGIPGSTLVCQLPRAYRRLARPSSPSNAKTSPMHP